MKPEKSKKIEEAFCAAVLEDSCAAGASAGSVNGTVGGVGWTGSTTSYRTTYFTCRTSIGRSAAYGDFKQVQAVYRMSNGLHQDTPVSSSSTSKNYVTYDCVHTPSMEEQHAYHEVRVDGKGQYGTSWA